MEELKVQESQAWWFATPPGSLPHGLRYKSIADPPESQDPLDWWIQHQDQYPVLKHLAFTLLAAPASTAADERLFSIAGNVVNEQRPHTQQQLAESVQCLRSWHHEGLI